MLAVSPEFKRFGVKSQSTTPDLEFSDDDIRHMDGEALSSEQATMPSDSSSFADWVRGELRDGRLVEFIKVCFFRR